MTDQYKGFTIDIWQGSEDWEQRYYYDVHKADTGELVFEGDDTFPKESHCLMYVRERIDELEVNEYRKSFVTTSSVGDPIYVNTPTPYQPVTLYNIVTNEKGEMVPAPWMTTTGSSVIQKDTAKTQEPNL